MARLAGGLTLVELISMQSKERGDNDLEMHGGQIEDEDMNQKELRILPPEKITRRFTFWRRLCRHDRTMATVASAVLMFFVLGCHNPAHDNVEAMMKRAQKQSSPGELQASVVAICATNEDFIPVQDLPHEILSLSDTKPSWSYIAEDKAGKRTLMVEWGGEMFSRGVGICPPGGVLLTNMVGVRIYRWSDGVFFFCDP